MLDESLMADTCGRENEIALLIDTVPLPLVRRGTEK